ncbi:glycosyltransferase family 4 protein [Carnobacterium sp. TMP28]|uniref:glycosyltransferase family 4 protein n=1 Tax=Carnobacterium sp. TMP28 TaxID=3397060 RepID=UPI0039E193D0
MQEKKDILFLCQFFYPEYISSATLPFDTAKALSESGMNVGVLCGFPNEYNNNGKVPLTDKYEEIEIKRLKYIQMKRSNILGRLINYLSFTVSVLLNLKEIKKYKLLIVYSNPPILPIVAAIANKLFNTEIVFVCYDIYPEIAIKTGAISEKGVISKVMNLVNTSLYKNINKVVALSYDMKKYLLSNRNQLRENQIAVIPNWYEDQPDKDVEISYANKLFKEMYPKEKLIISYLGNMGIAQDLNTLIDAIKFFKDNTEISFLFAGHGSKVSELKDTVENKSLKNVFIYDFLHGTDFQDALNISDIFIVSLESGLEGLAVPSKTYSYMMNGKPIIAIMDKDTDISQDIVNNKAGYGIEVGDVKGLVNAIVELNGYPAKRVMAGRNARKVYVKKHTTKKATLKYVEMMRSILEDK